MTAIFVVIVVVVAMLAVAQFVATWRAPRLLKMVNQLALRVNLIVGDELRPALEQQVAMRERGRLVGVTLALVVIAVVFQPLGENAVDLGLAAAPISVGLAFLSGQLGAIVGGVIARRSVPTNESVARLETIGLAELVAPVERRMAAIAAVVAIGLPTLLMIVTSLPTTEAPEVTEASAAPLALAGLAAGAVYLALPIIARRVTSHRAILGDTAALAWSDALAAQSLRDLHWLIAMIGGLSGLTALMALGTVLPGDANVAVIFINVSAWTSVLALLISFALVAVRSPERHVQRTLWPEFAIVSQ